jgi:hypothetical protein
VNGESKESKSTKSQESKEIKPTTLLTSLPTFVPDPRRMPDESPRPSKRKMSSPPPAPATVPAPPPPKKRLSLGSGVEKSGGGVKKLVLKAKRAYSPRIVHSILTRTLQLAPRSPRTREPTLSPP